MKRETTESIGKGLFAVLSLLLSAFWVMLVEGALASDFGWPTVSYGQSLLVVFALGSVVAYGTASIYWYASRAGKR